MKEIIYDKVFGGLGDDDDMTSPGDLDYTVQKLIDIANQWGLEKPFRFIIRPKSSHFVNPSWIKVMAELWLIDKNEKIIKTNELVWK